MHYRNRHRSTDYVMPFLIIICVGVILVLIFNLWRALFVTENARAAYMHIISGNAQMKTWGTEDYFDITSDAVMMQGDEIRSSGDAHIILEFFDGTLMRMDGGTELRFDSIVDDSSDSSIELTLIEGNLWFNKVYKDTGDTDLSVILDNIRVRSMAASIYEIENGDSEIVRVINVFEKNEGLEVDVLDGDTIVETEKIGLAQEIVFSKEVLVNYKAHLSPTVHTAISDDFKKSSWFEWNTGEDRLPTLFEKSASPENAGLRAVEPELVDGEEVDIVQPDKPETEVDEDVEESNEEEPVVKAVLTKPSIVTVAGGTEVDENGFYNVSGKLATLVGNVSGASKVVVNGYVLTKFKPGDSSWTYFANADYDLMKEGENIYEIYAEDAEGNGSEKIVVKVFYSPAVVEVKSEPEPEPETEPQPEPNF